MFPRTVVLAFGLLQASITHGETNDSSWDGSKWPAPIQQAFAEAIVWNSVTWDSDEEAEARAEKNSADALDRAFTLAKADSPRVYASVLVAAAEGSFGSSAYQTQLRSAVTDMLKSGQTARTLEVMEPMLRGPGRAEALEIVKAMRRDAEKASAAATDAAVRSTQILLGGSSDEDIQWCIEAITADPTFVPAWASLAVNADLEVRQYAAKQWKRLEPDNGAPDILFAETERRYRESVKQAVGLEFLESAAGKPSLSWPRFEMPRSFEVLYPDSERYREADIVGREVSPDAIEHLDFTPTISGPFVLALHNMYFIYLNDELKSEAGRVVDQTLQRRAARAISILAARICDNAGQDLGDFMRSYATVGHSLGFTWQTDDEKRTDLTPAERRFVKARRYAKDQIRASHEHQKAIIGSKRTRSHYDRLVAFGKLNTSQMDRETITTIRAETNFEEIVRAILAERASSPNSLE